MKNYKIRREFSELEEFTLNLPGTFDHIGSIIEDRRNIVKKVIVAQGTYVIKNFKGMYFLNRLVYSFFRGSKAERSFLNSGILNDRGIITPPNVGWIDFYNCGLLAESYYISGYSPYKTLQEVLDENRQNESHKATLYQHLLLFVVKLHDLGVYHNDFTLGNILVIPKSDGYEFSLVDLNRIRFQKVTFRKGLLNFNKLEIPAEDMNNLIREYARRAQQSPDAAVEMFWADNKRLYFLRRFRKTLRKYTLTPLEKVFRK